MNEALELLREMVSIPSTTGNTREAIEFLNGWCDNYGLKSEIRRGSIIINPDAEGLLLMGHIDTVPGEIPVRLENGELWGRGAVDAKGPLCASVHALKEMGEEAEKIKLIAVPDEEGNSLTAYRLRDEIEPLPTVILEPSGIEGITLSYNGRFLLEMEISANLSHSGHEDPFSAEKAFDIWTAMKTSCNPRILKMDSTIERTSMILDIRYGPDEEPILPEAGNGLLIDVRENVRPHVSDRNSALVRSFLRGIRSQGMKPVFKRKTGTCDMNVLGEKWDVPIIAYGPGDGRLDHTNEERIRIEEYLGSIEVLKNSLKDFLAVQRCQ
jgi:LysW-gamma-L-lysine carboxypeptidase